MRRLALSNLIAVQVLVLMVGVGAIAARAADCPNKWNEPKPITGKGAKKADAIPDFEKKAKELSKESKCRENKCGEDKGVCRALRTATQSCSGDDKTGWTCSGDVRVGCFCLEQKEKGQIAPAPATPPTPGEAACPNKFDDPKDAIGTSDTSEAIAKTAHDAKIKEYIDSETTNCAKHKCTGEKKACRLYYTTTEPRCGGGKSGELTGWSCKSQFRAGCFCLGDEEQALARAASGVGESGAAVSLPASPVRNVESK
ncbi:MAG: hypothetical protein Q7S58_02600 [Candidatus Binatus sp.]|uniref:hypothetical protein n=1 Tax=Candidatus Binatus sp. TaxID=2811406 RepID=UPI00271F8930|nr:hypothetical protein [Candidatus Binatus sp.]MDO8431282.1 hypothetical protein [Candidatus Binatus sp.]